MGAYSFAVIAWIGGIFTGVAIAENLPHIALVGGLVSVGGFYGVRRVS